MSPVETAIVLEWLLMVVGGVVFLAVFGRPWKAKDQQMAWHIFVVTLVGTLQPVAFLLIGLSLLPSAIIEGLALGLVWWRLGLLIQTRRRNRRRAPEEPPGGDR